MASIVKTILHSDGERRVLIFQRPDRLFTYEEQKLARIYDDDMADRLKDDSTAWFPVSHGGLTICDTQEAAEREGRSAVAWLADL